MKVASIGVLPDCRFCELNNTDICRTENGYLCHTEGREKQRIVRSGAVVMPAHGNDKKVVKKHKADQKYELKELKL